MRIGEASSGISEEMADVHAALQRAEDKTQSMQARANAIGELTAAGTLPDLLTASGDDVQAQLDQISAGSSVDAELAALKSRLGATTSAPAAQLGEHVESPGLLVRVQGSGQFRLAQPAIDALHSLDSQLTEAVHENDAPNVHKLLGQMANLVQTQGTIVGPDDLVTSAIVLPPDTITIEEVHALLRDDSLLDSVASTASAV
jgi:hypothetical protein